MAEPTDDHGAWASQRRRLLVDIRPLKESAPFRWNWSGQSFSAFGTQITLVATAVQVYGLTHSSFSVGLLGLFAFIPIVPFGLAGGSLADTFDRRKLVMMTSAGMCICSVLLAAQALFDWRQLWLIYALVALQQSVHAFDRPAQRTFPPLLLSKDQLAAGNALSQLSWHVSVVTGPFVAGALIASQGLQSAYFVDALTFFIALITTFRLPPMPMQGNSEHSPGIRSVLTGLQFARDNRLIASIMLVDFNLTTLAFPFALFPALAATHFGGGIHTVGWLYAAPGIGGILAAFFSGPVLRIRRQGLAMLIASIVFAIAVTGVGFTSRLWFGVACLIVMGTADVFVSLFRVTILQTCVPDDFRGRLNGVDLIVGYGGPRLGDIRAGSIAALTSPVTAIVVGGASCLAGVAWLYARVSELREYDSHIALVEPDRGGD